ncbi:MAG: ATP-dependent sacrificial sulfur transferase LarE [Actinomycetota bacterium]
MSGVVSPVHKLHALGAALAGLPGAVVAYSGGADSAFLAEVAYRRLGRRSVAVTADSASLPRRELAAAAGLAWSRGWRHRIVRTAELGDERYAANPLDRCAFCKSSLMDRLEPIARRLGVPVLIGTNLDDLGDWRPGQAVATRRGARQPLVDAGFSKEEVRAASMVLGLRTAQKPASACLASRIAYGVRVTASALERVERAEDLLLARGFSVVRVRDLGGNRCRVEVGVDEVPRLEAWGEDLVPELEALGFVQVELDRRGYRQGSLNEGAVHVELERVG